jgi:farnesyl diphosphate synthase
VIAACIVLLEMQQLYENYGKNDSRKIAKVKLLYSDLNLQAAYSEYEEKSHAEIQRLIQEVRL